MSDKDDIEVLANNLVDLLSGELKMGLGLMSVGKALGRQKTNKEWVTMGLNRWIEENEDAVPLLAATLGTTGVEKLKAWLDRNPQ